MYRRIRKVGLLINLVDDFSGMIKYRALTISDMIDEVSVSTAYGSLDFVIEMAEFSEHEPDIHKVWRKAVKNSSMGNKEKEIMILFGDMLGTSDINGQISAIEIYKKRLENLYEELEREYGSKGRMYRSAGVLIGIMAGIILL